MEEKIVRFLTILICLASLGTTVLVVFVPGLHATAIRYQNSDLLHTRAANASVMALMKTREQEQMAEDSEEAASHQLRLELPNTVSAGDIRLKDRYLKREIKLYIPGLSDDYFYEYPVVGRMDGIRDVTFDVKSGTGIIDFKMDNVYVCEYTESGRYLYLDFILPKDYYDHVVVIDAGHGGNMPGASSNDGKVLEKNLNLSIVKHLKAVFEEAGDDRIGVYYTRLKDTNPDFPVRVGLANRLEADVFLSVHINADNNPSEAYVNGTGVMYSESDTTGRSKRFAKNCLRALLAELGTKSKRTIPGDNIYIIRKSKVPVALAEIGFITNEEELRNLQSDSYQRRTAEALHRAIIKTIEEENP